MNMMTDLHGMVVHFPIALLFVGVGLELLALHPRLRSFLSPAALVTLVLGAVAAAVAVATGPDENARGVTNLVHTHEQMAQITLVLFGLLALWRLWLLWRKQPLTGANAVAYLLVACIGLGTLTYTGYLGGQMVYRQAIGVQRNGQLIVPPQPRHGLRQQG